jgi:hypothetical protein
MSLPIEERQSTRSATGPPGPLPRRNYCTPRCYSKGKHKRSRDCQCKGCSGNAHGQGFSYAFNKGYLKLSPIGSRKEPEDQELLPFPEASSAAAKDTYEA